MSIAKRYNKTEIAIIALLAFIALGKYSYDKPVGYTQHQVDSMSRLVEKMSKPTHMTEANARKMEYLYDN